MQSRLETEKAGQDKLKAEAQASAEQARQQGEIRIAQSRIQEESRQQTVLAELEREKIEAQRAVIEAERANELARVEANRAIIEAEKNNDLLAAQRDLEIQSANALAAAEKAKADVAKEAALAALYTANPALLQFELVQANANRAARHRQDHLHPGGPGSHPGHARSRHCANGGNYRGHNPLA